MRKFIIHYQFEGEGEATVYANTEEEAQGIFEIDGAQDEQDLEKNYTVERIEEAKEAKA